MGLVSTRGFYKLCLKTLGAVYFLIAVGGIVRPIGRKSSPVSARLQRVLKFKPTFVLQLLVFARGNVGWYHPC
jgi:hypothetical protein